MSITTFDARYVVSEIRALRLPLTTDSARTVLGRAFPSLSGGHFDRAVLEIMTMIAAQEIQAAREARAAAREVAAEKAFIRKILKAVLALDPHYVLVVDDGGETFECLGNITRAINVIYTVEQATVFVRNGLTREKIGTLVFILGNAPDEVLADWGYSGSPEGMRLDAMLDNLIV